jgi:hypothetical protein
MYKGAAINSIELKFAYSARSPIVETSRAIVAAVIKEPRETIFRGDSLGANEGSA